ncbi:MAG TPA: hypothetical protein VII78_12200 [Myxococcota bacterium]
MDRWRAVALTIALASCVLAACGRDAAEQAYFAALEQEGAGVPARQLIPYVDRAIALAPERAHYWQKRGEYRAALGELEGAEADFDRALALREAPFLRFERGLVRTQRGNLSKALADFDAAIAAQPANAQFYRGRALARVASGEARGGLADAARLLALSPADGESLYPRGVARAALGDLRAALADFDAVLRRRPDLIYVLLARANCLDQLQYVVRARADRAAFARASSGPDAGCGVCENPLHP